MRCAYVYTIFLDEEYYKPLIVSLYSLIQTNPKHDIVILYTPDIESYILTIFKNMEPNIILKQMNYIIFNNDNEINYRTKQLYTNIQYYTTKLNFLTLSEYDKILYLDTDTIILKNMDHYFNLNDQIDNIIINSTTVGLNSCCSLIKPSSDYQYYLDNINNFTIDKTKVKGCDEQILTSILDFRNTQFTNPHYFKYIRINYNMSKNVIDNYNNEYYNVLHYTFNKPWKYFTETLFGKLWLIYFEKSKKYFGICYNLEKKIDIQNEIYRWEYS